MHVIIIDDTSIESCEAHCGVDWSAEENIKLAGQRITERFSDRIDVQYIDLSKSYFEKQARQWQSKIKTEHLNLPLLVINGRVRISGQFDVRMLLDSIDAEREITYKGDTNGQ